MEFVGYGLGVGLIYIGAVCLRGARWLAWWHGEGEPHQYQFYRCHECRKLVTHFHIETGGCRCKAYKISPARLSRTDKVLALFAPWTVTSFLTRRAALERRAMVAAKAKAAADAS